MYANKMCILYTLILLHLLCVAIQFGLACPPGCTCTTVKGKEDEVEDSDRDEGGGGSLSQILRGRKVICSAHTFPITSIEQIDRPSTPLPLDTVQLDLSKNSITHIKKGTFIRLSNLRKLDLSHNQIGVVEPGAFDGLGKLERLDISYNKISSVNSSIFAGLSSLTKLYLSFNKINTIPDGTFNDLHDLKKLDFQSEYMRCDCHLQWIVKWSRDKQVKILPTTTCAVPRELKGVQLKTLKKKDLHCDHPLELPIFEIVPKQSQIVFEGDKLPFECRASIIDPDTKMYWLRNGEIVENNRSAGILVLNIQSGDHTIMRQSLVLEDLKTKHSGGWQCLVSTPQGNVTKNISITVISTEATYCEEVTVRTPRGVYTWARTIAGVQSKLPCKVGKKSLATYDCDVYGHWVNLNVTSCEFTNELPRRLQTLATENNSTKILSDVKELQSVIAEPFREKQGDKQESQNHVNVEFVSLASRAIQRFSRHASLGEDVINPVLISVDKIMNVSDSVLLTAQRQDMACTRIVRAIESIPEQQLKESNKFSKTTDTILFNAVKIPLDSFPGIQCSIFDLSMDKQAYNLQIMKSNVLVCSPPVTGKNDTKVFQVRTLTSILIPSLPVPEEESVSNATVESQATDAEETSTTPETENLQFVFIWYDNAKLFPQTTSRHEDPVLGKREWRVVSKVISASVSVPAENLTNPVVLTFEVPEDHGELVAAFWDFDANNGYGDWRTDGCQVTDETENNVIVHCTHLTIFAVLELVEEPILQPVIMFRLMEAVVYISSCICILCLMAVLITYVSCFRFINIPKKMKHSIINISISIVLLVIAFTMGVKRTDHQRACQIVGIAIHYLTLVAFFWITITSSNMYKKFVKADKPPSPPPEPVLMPLPPKPMLRFYLLGWGVPIIICGITAAVNMEFYSQPEYCFLDWEPGLGAFFGPLGFLFLLNMMFFVRISCVIRGSKKLNLGMKEEMEKLQVNDIELTQPGNDITNIDSQSIHSDSSSKSSVSSILDQERHPSTQLNALVAILVLFIISWVTGALVVAKPFISHIPHQELIFSYFYGVFCAILGLFMVIFFCLTRKDSRTSWRRFFLCEQQTVYNLNQDVPNVMPHSNGHVSVDTCGDNPDQVDNIAETSLVKEDSEKQSSVNLVPSAPPSVPPSVLEVHVQEESYPSFYNPRQNGVAKKFWDKRKHNSKLISRDMQKELNLTSSQNNDDNLSGSEVHQGHSQGYLSDGNTRVSIEIQFPQNNTQNSQNSAAQSPTQSDLPPDYRSCMLNQVPVHTVRPMEHLHSTPRVDMGLQDPITFGSPCCSVVSYSSSQVLPHHTRTPSASSIGHRNYLSAFMPVAPRNNTLPRNGKPGSPSSPDQESISPNGSAMRIQDFDGQSQVSSLCNHEKHHFPLQNGIQYVPGYQVPEGFVTVPNTYKQYGPIDGRPSFEYQQYSYNLPPRARTNSSSDSSSKVRHKLENSFVQEVHQRIPQDQNVINQSLPPLPPKSPVMSDSDNNRQVKPDSDSQIHYKKVRVVDSDHNSEPTSQSHYKHHKSRDSHKHSRHKGMTKQRSLGWEEQWHDKPQARVVPYVYVNHSYQDKVLQKLQSRALSENIDPKSKSFWVPKSSSSFEKIMKEESVRMMEDSNSSTEDDDDSLDDIWVLQTEKVDNKKETSV
ncbi:hypothetical protein CHS0354_039716 [Potamilus streckersoni]|uniref:Adhesion G protein-coupled receptor A3 n=1 Tax=Potamilus streckersoni TaxID=2493646 RepID=A0AAE0TAU7_9BIVA|nr:hypothetical protein CHS0354_039716 [Potamilus streckersoni]